MTAPLDSLRALAAADPLLMGELAAVPDEADTFIAAAIAIGRRHGLTLSADDLAELVAPDPIFMVHRTVPPLRRGDWPPPGWLPYAIAPDAGSLAVDWADFGPEALDGRFQTEAVRTALARPFNRLLRCRTGLAEFLHAAPGGGRAPDGFVFHMSRCGSTLVARMLAALPGAYCVNEAEPVDALLRAAGGAPAEVQVAILRAMVGAFGRRPSRRWFVKLSAWAALALPLVRRAFPEVPWIFLHRDPEEVLASQMITRAPELVPGFTPSHLFGIADGEALAEETYVAMALAGVCEAALGADGGLFVDHAELPDAFFSRILPHFGIDGEVARRDVPAGIVQAHAKHPHLPYRPAAATTEPAIQSAAEAWLAPLHARLKAVRRPKRLL